jgi:hypothetical protein
MANGLWSGSEVRCLGEWPTQAHPTCHQTASFYLLKKCYSKHQLLGIYHNYKSELASLGASKDQELQERGSHSDQKDNPSY